MDHDVFISHSSKDLGLVETLCSKLETNGIHCWYSERNVPKGTFYPGKIVDAIAKSKVLLLIHSLDADHSHNVLTEIACAFEKQMPIIPYKTAAFEPCDDMKYFLRLYQAINVYSHTGDEAWSLLVNELQNSIQRIPEVVVPLPVGTPVADDQPRFIRLYVKDIRSGDLHLWIKSGRSGRKLSNLYKLLANNFLLSLSFILCSYSIFVVYPDKSFKNTIRNPIWWEQ